MSGLGPYLSGLREERGLSIEEMARITRVAPRYLEALECEDLTALPEPVFTKGYIRAYCQAVGVCADEALAQYVAGAGVVVATPAPAATARTPDNGRRTRGTLLVSFALLVGFGLALFVVALYLQSGRPEVVARHAELPAPRAESRATPAAASAPPAPTPALATPPAPVARLPESGPASPPAPRPAAEVSRATAAVATVPALRLGSVVSPYRLVVRTSEATWLRVRTEDGRTMEETIPAGEVREWVSNRPFVVTVGNAGGVTLQLNGQTLPPLGGHGVVIGNLILPPPAP